jgi:hypothetical protein
VSRARRTLRALVFAAVLTVAAVAAHELAGGMIPGWRVLAATTAVLLGAGWLLAGRYRSPLVLAAAAVTGQVALHVTFCLSMARGSMSMAGLLCGDPHRGAVQPGLVTLHLASPTVASGSSGAALGMLAAHAVAAVVVLLGLRAAESLTELVAALLRAVALYLTVPAGPTFRAARRALAPAATPRALLRPVLLAAPRRGPPVSVCL